MSWVQQNLIFVKTCELQEPQNINWYIQLSITYQEEEYFVLLSSDECSALQSVLTLHISLVYNV